MRPYIIALRRFGFFALAATLALPLLARSDERAADNIIRGTSAPVGQGGMVVAQEALAARVVGDILKRGGNGVHPACNAGITLDGTFPLARSIGRRLVSLLS